MHRHPARHASIAVIAFLFLVQAALAAPVIFSVSFKPAIRSDPATGRLVVYLLKPDADVGPMHPPADGFVEEDPQPIYGIDVANLPPNQSAIVDDSATAFPVKLSALPAGKYRAQAVLDMHHENSDWRREPGNLYSSVVNFEIKKDGNQSVSIDLSRATKESSPAKVAGVEFVKLRSKLLSDFRGEDVYLRAGVALPVDYDAKRAYPAVYEVPGYGGDHTMAYYKAMRRAQRPGGSVAAEVARNTFWIFLDPESPNGHTLFADSDVNGPCGKALITELIPEIEKKFNLIAQPTARIITGHSSGGWSSLWLATEYPDFFGACWSSSPDPIDFRRLELVDIYSAKSMYVDADGKEVPSARFDGKVTMTTRIENAMEQVLGPRNDSAQQWDSWQAVWGHKDASGWPKPLYDPITGNFDRAEAETYRRFDIVDRLRKDPKHFVPIFRDHVHVVCGSEDTYYLNEAVKLLQHDLDEIDPPKPGEQHEGYVKLAPGNHQTVTESKAYRAWAGEMLAYLRGHGHAPATGPSK